MGWGWFGSAPRLLRGTAAVRFIPSNFKVNVVKRPHQILMSGLAGLRQRYSLTRGSPDPGDVVYPSCPENAGVDPAPKPYAIRIDGYLGPTALSAFPDMVAQLKGGDTLLTGLLDRSALYGVLAEIEALGLDLVELRRLTPK